jgi:hypothetical protein
MPIAALDVCMDDDQGNATCLFVVPDEPPGTYAVALIEQGLPGTARGDAQGLLPTYSERHASGRQHSRARTVHQQVGNREGGLCPVASCCSPDAHGRVLRRRDAFRRPCQARRKPSISP